MATGDGEDERDERIHNESVKLSATYLNGIAIAIFAVGGLTVPFNGLMQGQSSVVVSVVALICALASFTLHLFARRLLRRLR